ncbi:AraC family transcriptional regulator [Neorhizobium sp. P12A]|uniref:helix-turn-helix domain-containing protein n=1 Tax=Neorhizobium sp. P12A TaxID=2268027 RepID=UPI001FED6BAA|nr:AraC family transcriptional regulator [Neorhizobium sp. P12A]
MLGLQRQDPPMERVRMIERFVPVIPFPHGMISLLMLMLDETKYPNDAGEDAHLYLPRQAFDEITDKLGVDRITAPALGPGSATGDTVVENLLSCLIPVVGKPDRMNSRFLDYIGKAFNTHLVQRYGGISISPLAIVGGLTPWQLRRARDTIDARLDQEVSLAQLASDCGLSTSHFARAFARSTGTPPHRWLMQRRVDRAKELMLTGAPLAEIAVMCGFSDQSHLTRVFSQTTGMTPGRWRETQITQTPRIAVALGQEADPC